MGRKPSDWLYEDNFEPTPLMKFEQMRQVQKYGVEVGSHAIDHSCLSMVMFLTTSFSLQ